MAKKIKGITIEIGGDVQPLNKALEGVNKKSRDLQSELRQVERLLKLDPHNTELVAQKQKLLGEAVSNTKTKLDTLKEAQKQVEEQFRRGEVGEEQYRALQREVIKAEQHLKDLEGQLGEVDNKLRDAGKAMKDFGEDSIQAGKSLTTKLTAPIVGVGGLAYKMAADIEDAMGATEQIYKDAADSMKSWADGLDSYYGIAKGEALEYGNMMGTMLINIGGLTEDQAAKQARTLIELAGDLTAMYGGTTADAVRALTGALKGNNTMLDNYGMAANDALIKTKAMEMGLYDGTGQMDLAAKQAATLALIMEQSGAAQGQAAREADGASGSMRGLWTELKNAASALGEELLPVITPLISEVKDLVAKFSDLSPEAKQIIILVGGLLAALGPLLIMIGSISTALGAIAPLFGAAAGAAGAAALPVLGIVAAVAALIAITVVLVKNWDKIKEFFVNLWEGVKDAFGAAWEWIKNLFLNYHPVGLVIKHWEEIKQFFIDLWESVKEAFGAAWDWIVDIFKKYSPYYLIYKNWDKIVGYFTGIKDKVVGVFDNLKNGIVDVWQGIWNGIKGFINKIIGGLNAMIRGMNKLKFDIPDWVPLIGGKTWGINIPQIPKLHTGTDYFTPPNGMEEGLAILKRGEQVIPPGQSPATQEVRHTGEITIRGVNNQGETVGAARLIIEGMKDPRARLAVDSALAQNRTGRLRPAGVSL